MDINDCGSSDRVSRSAVVASSSASVALTSSSCSAVSIVFLFAIFIFLADARHCEFADFY